MTIGCGRPGVPGPASTAGTGWRWISSGTGSSREKRVWAARRSAGGQRLRRVALGDRGERPRHPLAPARRVRWRAVDSCAAGGVLEGMAALARLAPAGGLEHRGEGPAVREHAALAAASAGEGLLFGPRRQGREVAVPRQGHPARAGLPVVAGAYPGTGNLPAGRALPAGGEGHEGWLSGPARRRQEGGAAARAAVERAGRTRAHRRHDEKRQDAAPGGDPLRGHPRSGDGHRHRSEGRRRAAGAGGCRGRTARTAGSRSSARRTPTSR